MDHTGANRQPLLSILITNYDRRELLAETLRSILQPVDFPIEILVGNANTSRPIDGTYTGISDPAVLYVNHPCQYDVWENNRVLLRQSTGRYVTSIADDDLFHPTFFSCFKAALARDPEFTCLYTSYTSNESDFRSTQWTGDGLSCYSGDEFFDKLMRRHAKVMGNCGCFNRGFLERIDGFPQWNTFSYPDTYQALYLASCTETVWFVDQPLIFYREHSGSTSNFNRPLSDLVESQVELLCKMSSLLRTHYPRRQSEYLRLLVSRLIIPMYWHWKFVRRADRSCSPGEFRRTVLQSVQSTLNTADELRVELANALARAKYLLKKAHA